MAQNREIGELGQYLNVSTSTNVLNINASLNTVLVGSYTIALGNSLIITTGSRVVII